MQKIIWPNYLKFVSTLTESVISQYNIKVVSGEGDKDATLADIARYISTGIPEGLEKLPISRTAPTVALTGCSSFVGRHILFQLLDLGYPYKKIPIEKLIEYEEI